MGGCLSGGGGGGLSDTTRIDDGRKMSGSILASEHHIQSLQHDLEEFKNKLTDADNRINELETMIQDKTKELDIIRGYDLRERLEWQITATNAVNDRHYYEEQLYRIQCDIDDRKRDNDDDEEEEEIIKLKDELMKNNAKWREMLKREREIRNA
ncbi:hypothetical protein Pmar_PMAR019048 [Perkinsus marinus ATCC 50983]|uniref:Uncharacterized protein n=1 Tax=Perkinsus marinus (strain ATCC 50983 / TXsc) TaxID=423536 RepID=C5KTQ4_PERM5|nr:hypothetical protein Pmar_PMAR019048 [Perkinsus marinus ATCC 50983]EER11946.1 hypothetical protein Pmar_PMAR019048 [Perkinsus marinus ATCC 50983]|eukprot:XP_002780151.1 hypothetical protein Pmar_PMAR019048 [Perkinsus marinus ATCC 50983]